MLVKQLSVFVENKPGRLREMTKVLGDSGISLINLQIADTKEFGILRATTDDNERAVKILRDNGFTVSVTELIGVEIEDRPGALADILKVFEDSALSIEYLYSYARSSKQKAIILFRVDDTNYALKILADRNIPVIKQCDLK